MPITKSRQIAKLLKLDGSIKDSLYDSDAIVTSAQLGVTPAAGTAVYSSADTLPVSADNGDQALVSSTNRLYIFTNSGWYNIALINNTPYWITEANSSYDLSITGTATTITLLAQDSEGINIVYTATADSDFNQIATITKDSDNGRVFTIIPTDSENGTAVAGTGTITFRASDGVNLVSTLSSFSIEFIVQNSNYTTLLLKADSEGTDNQVDASTNAHTITEYGNVTSTAFTPHHPGGYSTYIDGTSNANIQIKGEPTLAVGTGNFSVSCWYKSDGALVNTVIASSVATAVSGVAAQLYWNMAVRSDGSVWIQTRSSANSGQQYFGKSATGLITANTWHHLVIARIGGVHYCAVDGVEDTSVTQNTATMNITTQELAIGLSNVIDYEVYGIGYIRDFNFCVGGVEYDLSAGNYTVPDEPVSAHANTKVLLANRPYIKDTSASPLTIDTIGSAVETVREGPYDYLSYSKAKYGGSVYFDGTGDYLRADAALDTFTSTSDAWTMEAWVYPPNTPPTAGATGYDFVFGVNTAADGFNVLLLSTGTVFSGSDYNYSTKATKNTWNHLAACYNGSELNIYLNGNVVHTNSWTPSTALSNCVLGIGTEFDAANGGTPGNYYTGYISNVRIVTGEVYTSAFTPPTAPLTAIANTQLLTCTNQNDIWDAANGARMSKGGNTTASGTEAKFTTSGRGAIYFDGTSDYLDIYPADIKYALGSKDFTIDMWVNFTATSQDTSYRRFFMADDGGNIANNFQLLVDPGGVYGSTGAVLVWTQNGSNVNSDIRSTTAINDGNWHHIAVSRTSNTVRLFVDGTRQGTNLTSWTHGFTTAVIPRLGSDATTTSGNYQGYIQDFRLLVGKSLYTSDSNITVPTEEFKG